MVAKMQKPVGELRKQRKLFASEYVKDWNAKGAAERAGYSKKTSQVQGSQLLSNLKVQEEIQRLIKEVEENAPIQLKDIVQQLANIVMLDEAGFYHDDGSVKELSELAPEQRAGLMQYFIKTIKRGDDYIDIPQFKTHDKLKAADMMMKYFDAYAPTKIEIDVTHRMGLSDFYPEPEEEAILEIKEAKLVTH